MASQRDIQGQHAYTSGKEDSLHLHIASFASGKRSVANLRRTDTIHVCVKTYTSTWVLWRDDQSETDTDHGQDVRGTRLRVRTAGLTSPFGVPLESDASPSSCFLMELLLPLLLESMVAVDSRGDGCNRGL